jgi:hypothetical protein
MNPEIVTKLSQYVAHREDWKNLDYVIKSRINTYMMKTIMFLNYSAILWLAFLLH